MSSTVALAGKFVVFGNGAVNLPLRGGPSGPAPRGAEASQATRPSNPISSPYLKHAYLLSPWEMADCTASNQHSWLSGCRLFRCRDYDRVRVRTNGHLVFGGEPPHHIRWRAGVLGSVRHVHRSMGIGRSTRCRIPCGASSPLSS